METSVPRYIIYVLAFTDQNLRSTGHGIYTNEPSKVDISNYMHTYKERGSKMENTSLHGFVDFSDSILVQYIPNQ